VRSMLVVTAYLALALTAAGLRSPIAVTLLWMINILLFCFAIIVSAVSRGRRRAVWLGFALLCVAHAVGVLLFPSRTPASLAFRVVGYHVIGSGDIYEDNPANFVRGGTLNRRADLEEIRAVFDAVATILCGFIGAALAVVATPHGRPACLSRQSAD
jgi:hypothetical protein